MTIQLSVIMPMFNEEDIVRHTLDVVKRQLDDIGLRYEIICVNDGSKDRTAEILDAAASDDSRVVPLHLSRNFGKEGALAAGIDYARGDATIILDADLQHPPSIIPKMVASWERGYDIVEARKAQRAKENLLYRILAKTFYAIAGYSSGIDIRGSSDFKLLDRQVVDTLKSLPERSRFFRGLVKWIGFKNKVIDFNVEDRAGGQSGWSTFQLLRYAINNILAFTVAPLYLVTWLGLLTTLAGVGLGVQTLYNYIGGNAVSGFTTVILLLIFFAGVILFAIGTVAIYLAKVIHEVKHRPTYIVRKSPILPRSDSASKVGAP